jgi:hypothetical protein
MFKFIPAKEVPTSQYAYVWYHDEFYLVSGFDFAQIKDLTQQILVWDGAFFKHYKKSEDNQITYYFLSKFWQDSQLTIFYYKNSNVVAVSVEDSDGTVLFWESLKPKSVWELAKKLAQLLCDFKSKE